MVVNMTVVRSRSTPDALLIRSSRARGQRSNRPSALVRYNASDFGGGGFLSGKFGDSGTARKTILRFTPGRRKSLRAISVWLVCFASLGLGIEPLIARQLSAYRAAKNLPDTAAIVRARAAWFFKQRASANGHIPSALLLDALREKRYAIAQHQTFFDQLAALSPKISAKQSTWTPLGPQPTANNSYYGNVSGRVTAIASDPCDATGNTVYVGGADGGVWASFNALNGNPVTWTPLSDSQPSLAIGSLALISSSCNAFNGHTQSAAIIAGTGESNYARDNLYGAGVLRSADGGHTWAQDQTFTQAASLGPAASGPYISAIAVQPNQSNPVLLAAVQGTDYSAAGSLSSGVWRSADGGNTWSRSQPGSSSASGVPFNPATDVVFDPSDSSGNTAYAALGDPEGDSDQGAFCSSAPCNGVYVSSDAGITWNRVVGLDASSTPSSYGNISLAILPAVSPATATLYVSIADSTTQSENLLGVLKGTGIQPNGSGPTFTSIYPAASNLPDFCSPLCFYDMKLAALPELGGDVIFAGGAAQPQFGPEAFGNSSIYRSLDGGNTWADVSADESGNGTSVHTNAHAFSFAVAPGAQTLALFVGNDGGVWVSTDVFNSGTGVGNQHWLDLNTNTGNPNTSLNLTQFYPGVSVHPSTDQILFGGTQGNDAQQFSGSLAWSDTLACPRDGGYTAIDPNLPTTIYVACSYLYGTGTLNKNIQSGTPGDGGVNWTAMDSGNGIDYSDNASFIPPLVIDSKNSQNLYFGTSGFTRPRTQEPRGPRFHRASPPTPQINSSPRSPLRLPTQTLSTSARPTAFSGRRRSRLRRRRYSQSKPERPARTPSRFHRRRFRQCEIRLRRLLRLLLSRRFRMRRPRSHFLHRKLRLVLAASGWQSSRRSGQRRRHRPNRRGRQYRVRRHGRRRLRQRQRYCGSCNRLVRPPIRLAKRSGSVAQVAQHLANARRRNSRSRRVELAPSEFAEFCLDVHRSSQRIRRQRHVSNHCHRQRIHQPIRHQLQRNASHHFIR